MVRRCMVIRRCMVRRCMVGRCMVGTGVARSIRARSDFAGRTFDRRGCTFGRSLRQSGSLNMMQFRIRITGAAGRPLGWLAGRKNRLLVLNFQMGNFLLDLGLEFVRGALEFIQRLAHLAGDLRQLLGPKDDEGQKEEEDRLRKTHASSYCHSRKSGNPRGLGIVELRTPRSGVRSVSHHGHVRIAGRTRASAPPPETLHRNS